MTNFIPIFPLGLVAFPGEKLNLHIFEPRYKELINDCVRLQKPFGIPSVIDKKVSELGTLMEITEITKQYEDGRMDIKTKGLRVFKILELVKEIPDKLYGGAIVNYQDNFSNGSVAIMKHILENIRQLHHFIDSSKDFGKPDEELCSYDVAHHIGLTQEDEYLILSYENELHRQEFIKRHLDNLLPLMKEMEALKKKIKLNGHFKNLEGFSF